MASELKIASAFAFGQPFADLLLVGEGPTEDDGRAVARPADRRGQGEAGRGLGDELARPG